MVAIAKSIAPLAPRPATTPASPPAKAAAPAPLDSVVYWGFNPKAGIEAKALDGASALDKPVTVIMSSKIGGTAKSPADVSAFVRTLHSKDPAALTRLLLALPADKLAEGCQFAQIMSDAEDGTRDVRRIVLSAHSAANRLWGDSDASSMAILENGVWLREVMGIAQCFPAAAGKVEHLLMSACSSGFATEIDQYRAAFPGLKSVVAWAGSSPATVTTAPYQLATWVRLTEKATAGEVDPKGFGGASGFTGSNVITWNAQDGYQGPTYEEARAIVDATKTMPPKGKTLDKYYFALMFVIYSHKFAGFTPEEQDELKQKACNALATRHPEVAPLNDMGMLKRYL